MTILYAFLLFCLLCFIGIQALNRLNVSVQVTHATLERMVDIVKSYNKYKQSLLTSKVYRFNRGSPQRKLVEKLSKELDKEMISLKDIKYFNRGPALRLILGSFFFNRHPLETVFSEYPSVLKAYTWWYT